MTALDEIRAIKYPTKLDCAVMFFGDPQMNDDDQDPEANKAAKELAAYRKLATIAADVNEWLIKIDLGGTGHQRGLEEALKELEAAK